jgi:aminoglycoside phosphotransferase (APT) family kinase protein
MSKPWTAEHRVDKALAQQLIESQFQQLAPAQIQFAGEGWDNVAYQVNNNYLFRFPRRQFGADCVPAEIKLLPFLAKQLPLPIPNPIFSGKPTAEYPWPFLGYQYLEGQEACAARLTMPERAQLATPLAQFLKALHSIAIKKVATLGAQHNRIRKLDIQFRQPQALEHVEYIAQHKLFDHCSTLFALLESLKELHKDELITLVHGDLYARHLLINKHRQLSGIIDWGDLQIDHPASDLSIVFTLLPTNTHDTFFANYGTISDHTKQLMLFNALRHTTAIAVFAHSINDANLLAEMLIALRLIKESAEKYI